MIKFIYLSWEKKYIQKKKNRAAQNVKCSINSIYQNFTKKIFQKHSKY